MNEKAPRKGPVVISDQAAETITRVEELAYELKIDEVMTRNMLEVSPGMKMREILDMFRQAHISGAPVVSDGNLLGIISIEDLIRCLVKGDLDAHVDHYMTGNVITIYNNEPVIEALKTFVGIKVGRLPVLDRLGRLVGILTKGDITRGLLKALQHDYQEEEVRRYRASHLFEDIESDRTSLILRYTIKKGDFTVGGSASANIKRALLRLGANPQIARRCGIATYEAEMNLIIHTTNGGVIRVEIEPQHIQIDAYDDGPGISDIDLALKPGYSTASEEIRELGFGAGMGLINIQRCVDSMKLESVPGKGTRVKMKILLPQEEAFGEAHSANKEPQSMNLDRVIKELDLTLLTEPKDFTSIDISAGYTSDLLSCVMSGAPRQGLWVTLQAHANIVAVAALLELSAVIITESAAPDPATVSKANQEGVILLSTSRNNFFIVGKLWEMGLRAE